MIHFLRVRNLAIVDELAIELGPGFNVLTGETGAGKSLLIDSLELLSGARGSSEMIRTGSDRLQAEAILQIPENLVSVLAEAGIPDLDATGEVVIRRELGTNGRGRVTINGSMFAVRELAAMMEPLLEIHGQDAGRDRIAGQTAREIVDTFAGLDELCHECADAWQAWQTAAGTLERLRTASAEREQRLDLLRYQVEELSNARLAAGEEDELRSERAILANSQALTSATAAAWGILEEDENAATTALSRAISLLRGPGCDVEELRSIVDGLEQGRLLVVEGVRDLERFASSVRHDPERLDEIEDRLALLERLHRKYDGSSQDLLTLLERLRLELEETEDAGQLAERAQAAEQSAFEQWKRSADILSRRRRDAAPELAGRIRTELEDLAMPGTAVRFDITTAADSSSRLEIDGRSVAFGPEGYDRVEILIAPNRGEEPKPLAKIASGGELSRIQLAIATATFHRRQQRQATTLVFDEIDSGVGGATAESVGRKLLDLSRQNQVICVTHLPQIAALGDTHFRVWKESDQERTTARIERLEDDEARAAELARMLGGDRVAGSALEHARELLRVRHADPGSGAFSARRG